ncbi:MAG: DUF6206 family protein [Candidatus Diapherotrites archaeon]|nr:DUF6206 family protein [Candidatus Diapherotrites archaeon]
MESQGFFTSPKIAGGFAIKEYSGFLTEKQAMQLLQEHRQYLKELENAGITTAQTQMHFERTPKGCKIRIIQEAFDEKELVKQIIASSGREQALKTVGIVLQAAEKAIVYSTTKNSNFGFHPSLRNFALKKGILYYIDTFPPLVSRKQVARTIRMHSPWPKSKIARIALSPIARIAASEYYNPERMINGILASASRLRPELKKEFLEAGIRTSLRVLPKKAEKIRKLAIASIERKGYRKAVDFLKRIRRK